MQSQEKGWGEEIIPGITMLHGNARPAAADPLVATPAPANELDLKQTYDRIDAAQLLANRLIASNEELFAFFSEENKRGGDDDAELSSSSSSGEEENQQEDENVHADPNENSGGGGMDMNSLLAMDGTDVQEQDAQINNFDDDEKKDSSAQKKKESNARKKKKRFDGANPDARLLSSLPEDIQDDIMENLAIISEKKREIEDLVTMTAVRQHKCGQQRVHGAPPPEQNDL